MKKLAAAYSEHIGQVRLYIDDLQQLAELFSGVDSSAEFKAGGYQFDTVAELLESGHIALSDLNITAYRPYVSLGIEAGAARLYRADDSTAARGLFDAAREVLNRRRSILRSMLADRWGIAWVAPAPLGLVIGGLIGRGGIAAFVAAVLAVLLLTWFAGLVYCAVRPGPAVVLVKSSDRVSVFKQHAPAFIIAVTSAIVGTIVGGVIAAYLGAR